MTKKLKNGKIVIKVYFLGGNSMDKPILDIFVARNEFPIIFVGSGITKRYLVGYPSWSDLLEELWQKCGNTNYFGYLGNMREHFKAEGVTYEGELDFAVNVSVASKIEKDINEQFFNEKIVIDGLTAKDAYVQKISPFKKMLANRFKKYQVKDSYREELSDLGKMLVKAQIILTTNYDTFIEDSYNAASTNKVQTYIGQQGFFRQTPGFAELYKIHGCTTDVNSITITREDYTRFDKDSVLISAKIISMLLHSPIIFLGYSLTDRNVRKIIKDFTSSLKEHEITELEKRLVVVQWKEGQKELEQEVISDPDLGCRLTLIRTDNYQEIYKKIALINQGVTPAEVRRFEHVISRLVVERGKKGDLKTVLVSMSDLDKIDEMMVDKNLVVAIGDSKLIYNMPSIVDYMFDYISGDTDQNLDMVLRFIASLQTTALLPFKNYVTEQNINESSLHDHEKEKLRKRIKNHSDIQIQINHLLCHEEYNDIDSIRKLGYQKYREHEVVAYNIDRIQIDEVKQYILDELSVYKERGEITIVTQLRRLVLIYDLKIHQS